MSLPPWSLLSDVLDAVAASLGQANGVALVAADPRWTIICTNANNDAASELFKILRASNFSESQMLAWDDGPSFNRRLAQMFAIPQGAVLGSYSADMLDRLDVRKDLKDNPLTISIGGVPTAAVPGGSAVGGIVSGMSNAALQVGRNITRRNLGYGRCGYCGGVGCGYCSGAFYGGS